jgi:hypothetical protein
MIYIEGLDTKEYTPLCMAVEYSNVEMVEELLVAGLLPHTEELQCLILAIFLQVQTQRSTA